ncbi:endonuclease-reverse transcriptase [Elysia marginata]|uniref:Endonuclease-reverse transcriptase n=1 Tax=Elysia marginata TaxID=1093978 RepID=A0AAV4ISE5_9GAST|nr:endonuclease-reverse transcriptase [Elysia marginata]
MQRAIEGQKDDVYLCFIDYTKAFDRVRHDEIMKDKDLRIIKNIYWEHTAAMRVDGETSTNQKTKRGVRQGCVLSLDLFSLYSELIMRNIDGLRGHTGGHIINNLRYADDIVLIAENARDLQRLLDIVREKSKNRGLEINSKKTEITVVSRKETPPNINIYINDTKLQQRDQFKYLGALISSDGRNTSEISSRIAQSKTMFKRMKNIWTNPHMSIETRKRVLECYIEPILMYGCETWIISKQTRGRLEATEMWFLRRMMRIPWIAKKPNDTVLSETKTKRALINKMRKRQATFFGHIMRRERQEHLVTTGMFMGRRGRGRLREKMTHGLRLGLERALR